MNIAFLTRFDPRDIKHWSGTLYYMYNKLKEKHNIKIIGPGIVKQLAFFTYNNNRKDADFQIDKYIYRYRRLDRCSYITSI